MHYFIVLWFVREPSPMNECAVERHIMVFVFWFYHVNWINCNERTQRIEKGKKKKKKTEKLTDEHKSLFINMYSKEQWHKYWRVLMIHRVLAERNRIVLYRIVFDIRETETVVQYSNENVNDRIFVHTKWK